MRRVFLAALLAAAGFGVVTLLALEGAGMAQLRTMTETGEERRTRVWFAEEGGAFWIEAATAERPFYLDLAARPELQLDIRRSPFEEWTSLHGRAELVAEPGGHERIRSMLRERYGWADAWVALLQDTSASRALRIVVDETRRPR